MALTAIGPIAGGFGSLSGLGGVSIAGGAPASAMNGSLGSAEVLTRLLQLISEASIDPSARVAISDTARGILEGDAGAAGASMGELSQALIVALMLQLLDV